MATEQEYAEELAASGIRVAQTINDQVLNTPDFRKWSNETLMLGSSCLAAGFARVVELPEEDFILLCRAAYKLIRAEPKTSLILPPTGDRP